MVARHRNILFAIVLLPVFLVAVFSLLQTGQQMTVSAIDERKKLASLSAQLLNEKLDHVTNIGLSLSERPVMRRLAGQRNWSAAMATLKDIPKDFPFVFRISICDSTGFIRERLPAIKLPADSVRFLRAGTGFTDVYMEEADQDKILFALIMPVNDTSGKAVGRIVLEMNADLFFAWTRGLSGGGAGALFVANSRGTLVAGPPGFAIARSADFIPTGFIQHLPAREAAPHTFYNTAKKKYYYYSAEKIPRYGWALLVEQEPITIFSFLRKMWLVLIFYILMLLLSILLAIKVKREIFLRKESEANLDKAEENAALILQKRAADRLGFLSLQIDQSNDAIFVVDRSKKIMTWNKGAEKLYGFTKEEATGMDPNELLQSSFSSEELNTMVELLEKSDYWAGEIQRKAKGGEVIFVRSSSTTIRNEESIITGYVAVSFDITSEKKMGRQISHLAGIVEQSSEAIISMTVDQQIITWNRGAENLFGYSKEEALKKTARQLGVIGPGTEEALQIEEALKTTGTWTATKEYLHKNGDSFFGGVTANAMTGEIRSIIFIIKDITPHKKLELQLKHANEILEERVRERTDEISKNEKRWRALIENSAEGIVLTSANSTVIYRSPSAARITGKLPGDPVVSLLHPDDQSYFEGKRAEAQSLPGVPVAFQARFLHALGHYFWLEGTMTNMLQVDGVNAMVANYRDVSTRKYAEEKIKDLNQELALSERKFRGLIENGQDLIALLNANNEVIYRSPAYWRVSGWQPHEYLQAFGNETPFMVIHPDDQDRVHSIAADCLSKPGIPLPLSYRFMHRDGYYLWMEGTIINLLGDESIRCIVTNLHDITGLKKAEQRITDLNAGLEQRINERTAQLQAVNRELEAFSYSVSHDLRAPLRAIVGFTAILDEEYAARLDPEAKRITGVITKNTLKMGNLIDDLLAFSRLGRQEINKGAIETRLMVEQVVAELDRDDKKAIQWEIASLPRCYGDFNTLRQVWVNYISNAIKYSGKMNAPKIEIGCSMGKDEQVFFVRDNGVGFNKEYENKLFRVFQRLHASSEFEGTGVGLAIAEKIITRHCGKVWAESETGKGACFYFSLPKMEHQFLAE